MLLLNLILMFPFSLTLFVSVVYISRRRGVKPSAKDLPFPSYYCSAYTRTYLITYLCPLLLSSIGYIRNILWRRLSYTSRICLFAINSTRYISLRITTCHFTICDFPLTKMLLGAPTIALSGSLPALFIA